jgi:hypothetical protein
MRAHFFYSHLKVVWENVRTLKGSGETVSVDGTHLGHNLPDRTVRHKIQSIQCDVKALQFSLFLVPISSSSVGKPILHQSSKCCG